MEIGWGQQRAPTKDLSKDLLSVPTAPAAERSRSKILPDHKPTRRAVEPRDARGNTAKPPPVCGIYMAHPNPPPIDPGPRHRAPTPTPSDSETFSLVKARLAVADTPKRNLYVQVPGGPVLSNLSPYEACSEPRTPGQLPS
ncbi:hypothetical protein NA56DRAFT_699548 [Hyaloscypha hepaticicola]|uniref:Uncharacterized protein n=1 Tax=Hyaloscypha hepaticicola TaxID=2082293 RepID=A0A2J6QEQ4_9HELO|nr:hypothetical protein NA56DRAFT_699548 [Hyaloscypha hepaticicola]